MRKFSHLLALVLLTAAVAACDEERPIPNEFGDANLVIDETPCGPEHNRVCP